MMKIEHAFNITYTQQLDEHGNLHESLPEFIKNDLGILSHCYKIMALTRIFDQKAVALQRTGQLGTYASSLGQEAIGAAIGSIMDDSDVFVPYYRDYSAMFMRGVSMVEILQYWGGDERGNCFQTPKKDLSLCIPIATQCCHAVGIATGMKIKHQKHMVIVSCGDGATSKGDFLESINVAGVWQLPVVFVVSNNQWAISVPRHLQTAAATIAQKAISAGIHGEQVDGNDIVALLDRIKTARDRAIKGKGPSLIEAVTYRLSDHTTADDASRYRSNEELKTAWSKEPLKRLREFLFAKKFWSEDQEIALQEECKLQVKQAVEDYMNIANQPIEYCFDFLYDNLPNAFLSQRDELLAKFKRMQGQKK